MMKNSELFLINKCSSMTFEELSKYLKLCFNYLENPQKHLAIAKSFPNSKETYDLLFQRLEFQLSKIEKLVSFKNEIKKLITFTDLNGLIVDSNTLVSYNSLIKKDKKAIEADVRSIRRKANELLLILLKCLFSEIKIAAIFVNASEPYYKILNWLNESSKANKEIANILAAYNFNEFDKLFTQFFQFDNINNHTQIINWFQSDDQSIDTEEFSKRHIKNFERLQFRNASIDFDNLDEYERFMQPLKLRRTKIKKFVEFIHNILFLSHIEANQKFRIMQVLKLDLDDTVFNTFSNETDFQRKLNKILSLEEDFSKFATKQNTDTEILNKLSIEYEKERKKYINTFIFDFNALANNAISQIDNEIKNVSKVESISDYLQSSRESLANLQEIRDRVFSDSKQKMIVKEIFWDLLPQGEWKTEGLIKIFKGFGWSKDEFDENRLTQIIKELKPNICYVGKQKFQGYVVFGFNSTKKVVLECPKYGNAIYVIRDRWQEITKLSKWEARQLNEVTVIRHNDKWFKRLKEILGRSY